MDGLIGKKTANRLKPGQRRSREKKRCIGMIHQQLLDQGQYGHHLPDRKRMNPDMRSGGVSTLRLPWIAAHPQSLTKGLTSFWGGPRQGQKKRGEKQPPQCQERIVYQHQQR
jgi:hypothetical protein